MPLVLRQPGNGAVAVHDTLQAPDLRMGDDLYYGLSGRKENWVSDPSRMIVMHEPPAFWYFNYYHWHYARAATTVPNPDGQKFISPILFVDGHGQQCDFTAIIRKNMSHGLEPGKDWMWYKPLK